MIYISVIKNDELAVMSSRVNPAIFHGKKGNLGIISYTFEGSSNIGYHFHLTL